MGAMKYLFHILLACALLCSCVKEKEQPPRSFTRTSYTLNITAVRGGSPDTRALSLDGLQLKASWAAGETVSVLKGKSKIGELRATSEGVSTTFSGTVTKALSPGDELSLEFLSPDYTHQDGSLDYIASHCDYATASVTVTSVEETDIRTTVACFDTWQGIVEFHLVDAADPTRPLAASSLDITVDDKTITVTPEAPASDLFVALPVVPDKPVSLRASVGDKIYSLYKHSATLEVAVYYSITA